MTKRLDDIHLTAWRIFLTAHAVVIDDIERELAAAGKVPLTSYDVLLALSQAPERRLRMSELAREVVLSRSGLTRLVDRLEAEGLLTRERVATDRRGAFAVLTDDGFEALRTAWPVYARGIIAHFADLLNDAEAATLTELLQRVIDSADDA
jgi:DNA-binding MarR family transcriptional regulator